MYISVWLDEMITFWKSIITCAHTHKINLPRLWHETNPCLISHPKQSLQMFPYKVSKTSLLDHLILIGLFVVQTSATSGGEAVVGWLGQMDAIHMLSVCSLPLFSSPCPSSPLISSRTHISHMPSKKAAISLIVNVYPGDLQYHLFRIIYRKLLFRIFYSIIYLG